jgi:3-isopropylmalate dehydratase
MAAAAAVTGKLTDVRTLTGGPAPTGQVKITSSKDYLEPIEKDVPRAPAKIDPATATSLGGIPKFGVLKGVAAPLDMQNVDTDMIIPKQFLKTIKRSGLGKSLFYEIRFSPDGKERPEFVLNKPQYRQSSILIAGENFGCGSSREHAPWALQDFGIQCVIAPSFADIFFNNCFKNGMLPIVLPQTTVSVLMKDAVDEKQLQVNLPNQTITRSNGDTISFEVESFRKHCLVNGLDDIGLTLQKDDQIVVFEKMRSDTYPWLDGPGYGSSSGPVKLQLHKEAKTPKINDW